MQEAIENGDDFIFVSGVPVSLLTTEPGVATVVVWMFVGSDRISQEL